MNARTCLSVLALGALAVPASPARALPVPVPRQVVALPNLFAVSEITIYQGDTLTLTNLDPTLISHDLVSLNYSGGVRIFGSDPVAPGAQGEVRRVSTLRPGRYPFLCASHENMRGNLTVETAPAL